MISRTLTDRKPDSETNLLLIVLRVVDKENAVLPAVSLGGLLESDSDVHPTLRLPVSPPAQRTFTHPHRLQGVDNDL